MKNTKFSYETPELTVIGFAAEDVITSSEEREPAELEEIED